MKKVNNNNKSSAKKKLIPAAGSLMISAAMLGTSTFAWFTMSREVEVKNIKMTATVPEDIQISLGHLVNFSATANGDALVSNASTFTGLSGNQGILKSADNNAADNGNVMAPYNNGNDAVTALDWASSADISEYYRLGKIIPASSTTGENIFFTPDAAGVGKTLKAGAKYYQAASISGALMEAASTGRSTDKFADGSLKTTLHAINNQDESQDKWNDGSTGEDNTYKTATEWNITNDDGYFVDIPIWFRSSAQDKINLSVDAYVTTTQAKDDDDLYCAARAVILYNADAETGDGANKGGYATAANATSNLIRIKQDGLFKDGDTATKGDSIVNYMYTTNSTGDAVNGTDGTYGNAIEYQGLQFIPVAAGANNTYGPMTKAVIRVWLEGEDPNCWNSNAGQDFNISLVFSKDNISNVEAATVNNGNNAITTAGTGTYATTKISHDGTGFGDSSKTDSLKAGARVWVKSVTTVDETTQTDLLQFEYNGDKWSLVSDGSFHKYEGHIYKLGDKTINNSDDIADYLKDNIKTLANVEAHDTTTDTEPISITVT